MALLPGFRALHIAATVLIGGAFAFDLLILRPCATASRGQVATDVRRWMRRQCAWGLGLALVSWAGWLAAIAMTMSGLPPAQALAPDVIGTVIARTTFGHVWVIRLALLVVLALRVHRCRDSHALAFAAAAALVASLAWTGHALGTNHVHVWVDAMHLLAATTWLGMLPLLWLVICQAAQARVDAAEGASWRHLGVAGATQFFVPGAMAVAVLALSGLANTMWMVDSVSDLVATRYGRILSLKLALFALMLMLAAANRFIIIPRADGSLRALRLTVLAELVLGGAVLAAVAWLGVTPPAAHEHMVHSMQGM